ncbi:helix-turn-helix domain-containing protein [Streptomyces sp. K1PA1]|uniref:Helix-turn-helix domain-containing protein n=2 Tax=Streptomyces tropicalis TaxID=3034234 RepID=A0ABT6AE07_9ACTN|nr:helix-turn-helix domain-containing protein [Streptomyces tropicalis]
MKGAGRRTPPGGDTAQAGYLASVLRELKDRSGLSLSALAARTPYSRSSWNRYLRGEKLPPRQAVEMLGRLAGEPLGRLTALWEQAEAQTSGRAASPAPGIPQEAGPSPVSARRTKEAGVDGEAGVAGEGGERGGGAEGRPAAGTARRRSDCRDAPTGPPTAAGSGESGTRRPRPAALLGHRGPVAALLVAVIAAAAAWTATRLDDPGRETVPPGGPRPSASFPVTVGCHGTSCAGRDADAMACDIDAATYAGLRSGHSLLELRGSPDCASVWARVSGASPGDRVTVEARPGPARVTGVPAGGAGDGYVVTPMLPAGPALRACRRPRAGGRACTPWTDTALRPSPSAAPGAPSPAAH